MKHCVCGLAGRRLEIKDSPTTKGGVLVQILNADRAVVASMTFMPDSAAVAADALEREAQSAEARMAGEGA